MDTLPENEYLTPDPLWQSFGIKSFDQFLEKNLILGKFHKDVPEDVVTEYKSIEYLLSHSYFYYPLIDCAFLKATTIFEMAVRIKCNQLGIEIPKKKHVSLDFLLKELGKVSHSCLSDEWNNVKKIRNHFAHPKQHQLMGVVILQGFYQLVNILNKLFLPNEFFNDLDYYCSALTLKTEAFTKGLFILEYKAKRYLIHCARPYLVYKKGCHEISFWGFHPVLNKFPQTIDEVSSAPIIQLSLENIIVENEKLKGTILHTNEKIELYPTNNASDKEIYSTFGEQERKAENGVSELFLHLIDQEISKGMVSFQYNEFWN